MSFFRRKQVTVVFTVKEEIVPGLFYDPQDFADHAYKGIAYQLQAYKPELVETKVEDVNTTRL